MSIKPLIVHSSPLTIKLPNVVANSLSCLANTFFQLRSSFVKTSFFIFSNHCLLVRLHFYNIVKPTLQGGYYLSIATGSSFLILANMLILIPASLRICAFPPPIYNHKKQDIF